MNIHNTTEDIKTIVDEKVQILYDFCVLNTRGRYNNPDPLETEVREFLTARGTEFAMQSAIIDVITYKKSIYQMLKGGK